MSSNPRASNPSGASLLDQSTAHPGSIDKSIFETKSGSTVGQGTVNSNYLKECREDNPDPAGSTASKNQVALSNCRFLTPTEELRCDEPFEMAVDAKVTGSANLEQVIFRLYSFLAKDGKEERSKVHTWLGSGKSVDPKADPVVVKATGKLVYEMGTDLSKPVPFEIEAKYCQQEPAKSPRVEVPFKNVAHWMGGDDLHFATDAEFPLLGADGGLIQVLSAAVKRFEKPVEKGETTICFGFATSAGDADHNRKLSLRRAQVVKAILDRDTASWKDLAKANFETRDLQQFLKDLHTLCGWECDPGAVDGISGPKTKAAISSFQREYDSRWGSGKDRDARNGSKLSNDASGSRFVAISPRTSDGIPIPHATPGGTQGNGPDDGDIWMAVLRVILGMIQVELGQDPYQDPTWPKAKWGHAGKGVYGNGEDFATGGDKPEEISVQITFFSVGVEPRLEDPKPGQNATIKDNPVQNPDVMEKVKINTARCKDAPINYSEDDELFSITSGEVGVISASDRASFDRETKRCELVNKEISKYLFPDSISEDQDQNIKACLYFLRRFCDESDETKADYLAAHASSIIEAKHKESQLNNSDSNDRAINGSDMESAEWIQKVYSATGKRATWVRSKKLKSHWRKFSKKQVLQQINKEYEDDAKGPKSKAPCQIGEVTFYQLIEPESKTWAPHVEEYFEKLGIQECLKEDSVMEAKADIQILRYAYDGKIESDINWSQDQSVSIQAKSEGSINLISGQGSFDISLPSKEGFDLIGEIKKTLPSLFVADTKPMPMQVQLKVTGNAFVGVWGSISGGFGLSIKNKPQGGLECGLELFAGAKLGAELGIAIRIKLWNESTNIGKFEDLVDVSYGAWAAIGYGVEVAFNFGYYKGKYKFLFKAGLVLKGGAGHYLKATVQANKIADMIWTIGCAVNWTEMGKFLSDEMWSAYRMLMFNAALTGKTLQQIADQIVGDLDTLLSNSAEQVGNALTKIKIPDGTFDRYVSGYSIAKEYAHKFWITTEAYDLLKQYNGDLEKGAAAVNTVKKIKNWKYVTREDKHNWLVEICQSGTGWFGPFTGEDKEDAIIKIMSTIRDKAEYDWVMDELRKRGIDLDSHVDWSQQKSLDAIRAEFRKSAKPKA